jgi:hypothetical protein
MAFFLAPVVNSQILDANGDPLVGGKILTYLAGSTTPAATYTSNTGGTQQANPVVLNSLGAPASPIWLAEGVTYKFVITSAADAVLRTIDNVEGINDAATSASEWVDSGFVPTYANATSFTVPGDQTDTLHVGRRLKTTNTAGTIYSTITVSAFTALTTVTVVNDSGVLDSGLSSVSYGLLSKTNHSIPSFGASLAVAGYQKLPGGLILQWGFVASSGTANGNAAVTFPIAFPATCVLAVASATGAGAASYTGPLSSSNTTGAVFTAVVNGANTSGMVLYWFALGY